MTLEPSTRDELAAALRAAHLRRTRVERIDLRQLNRVIRYAPEDLTVTVEAGITLASLQEVLCQHRQWLPVDPPGAETLAIASLLDRNLSGPRRFGHGTIREHLIGIRVALADGRIIHSGGEVVKNVAGYDLMKVFIGAERSLGVIVEAAFKLLPLPEIERCLSFTCPTWEVAAAMVERIMESPLVPTIFDMHNLAIETSAAAQIVLGFAGTHADVEWQTARAAELGIVAPADLAYENSFHTDSERAVCRLSVLPSRLVETIAGLGPVQFVARAGNGVIHCCGGAERPGEKTTGATGPVSRIGNGVKQTYDPHSILPPEPVGW